jgi:hypothetical protein
MLHHDFLKGPLKKREFKILQDISVPFSDVYYTYGILVDFSQAAPQVRQLRQPFETENPQNSVYVRRYGGSPGGCTGRTFSHPGCTLAPPELPANVEFLLFLFHRNKLNGTVSPKMRSI